ncbi:MAG: hypothetical protein AAF702_45810 [Chloroflexota bacterium]
MKATVYAELDPADTLQHQGVKPSTAKVNAPRQPLADALMQFIVRRPRTFTIVYGSGSAIAALWLFISSVQKSEWIWTIGAASWLVSIVTCVGGILYLLSTYTPLSHHPDSQITISR